MLFPTCDKVLIKLDNSETGIIVFDKKENGNYCRGLVVRTGSEPMEVKRGDIVLIEQYDVRASFNNGYVIVSSYEIIAIEKCEIIAIEKEE